MLLELTNNGLIRERDASTGDRAMSPVKYLVLTDSPALTDTAAIRTLTLDDVNEVDRVDINELGAVERISVGTAKFHGHVTVGQTYRIRGICILLEDGDLYAYTAYRPESGGFVKPADLAFSFNVIHSHESSAVLSFTYEPLDTQVLAEAIKDEIRESQRRAMIAISFDDGFPSITSIADILEIRGMRCGFAVHETAVMEYGSRAGFGTLRSLQSRGFEIMNHSKTHPIFLNINDHQAAHEVADFAKQLQRQGIKCRGFVTPNSEASDSQLSAIKKYHEYAYTVYSGDFREGWKHDETIKEAPFRLGRAKIWDGVDGKSLLDQIASEKALASFYEHDMDLSDTTEFAAFLDKCELLDIHVVTPTELIAELCKRRGIQSYDQTIFPNKLLVSEEKKIIVYEGTETATYHKPSDVITVSNNGDGDASYTIYTDDVLGNLEIDANDSYSVYAEVQSLAGSGSCSLGLLVYDTANQQVAKLTEGSSPTDSKRRRYSYTSPKLAYPAGYSVRPFVNIAGASAGSQHKVLLGVDADIEKSALFGVEQYECFYANTTIEHDTFKKIDLNDADRDLFKIENGVIVAKENLKLTLNLSASGDALSTDQVVRGVIKIFKDSIIEFKRDVLLASSKPVYAVDTTILLRSGDKLEIQLWHLFGATLTLSDTYYSSVNMLAEAL